MAFLAAPPIPSGANRGAVLIAILVPTPVGLRIVITRPMVSVQTAYSTPSSVGYAS